MSLILTARSNGAMDNYNPVEKTWLHPERKKEIWELLRKALSNNQQDILMTHLRKYLDNKRAVPVTALVIALQRICTPTATLGAIKDIFLNTDQLNGPEIVAAVQQKVKHLLITVTPVTSSRNGWYFSYLVSCCKYNQTQHI